MLDLPDGFAAYAPLLLQEIPALPGYLALCLHLCPEHLALGRYLFTGHFACFHGALSRLDGDFAGLGARLPAPVGTLSYVFKSSANEEDQRTKVKARIPGLLTRLKTNKNSFCSEKRRLFQPLVEVVAHEGVVVEMRIGAVDAVDFLHLPRREIFARIETPTSG
jgi:hypothetical protein